MKPDRASWTADQLNSDETWLYQLSEHEVEALWAQTRSENVGADDLLQARHLSVIAALVSQIRSALIDGSGFILVRHGTLRPEKQELLKVGQAALCKSLGTLCPHDNKGRLVKEVTAEKLNENATPFTVSHRSRTEMFPHSDSAEIVSLLCITSAVIGGETTLASSIKAHEVLQQSWPDALQLLYRELPIEIKGKAEDVNGTGFMKRRVFEMRGGRMRCHYNRRRTDEGARMARECFDVDVIAALDTMDEIAAREDLTHRLKLQSGDNLFINNDFVLHGRTSYVDPPAHLPARLLLRTWVTLSERTVQ